MFEARGKEGEFIAGKEGMVPVDQVAGIIPQTGEIHKESLGVKTDFHV